VVVLHPRRHLYWRMALHQEKSSQKRSDQSADISTIFYEDTDADVAAVKTEGSGKHTCCANTKYADFWRHANDKDEDLEVPGL
jgi:hypothetical protein